MVAFTVGIVLGGFSVQGYSAEWLKQVGLIVAVLTALSAGVLNLIKLQEMKQQQRWELQKPMLLGLVKALMQLNKFQGEYIDLQYELEDFYNPLGNHERDWINERSSVVEKKMVSASQESGQLIEELDEVWATSLPRYLSQALKRYREESDRIIQGVKDDALTSLDAYWEDNKAVQELLPHVRKACVEMSGVLK